MTWLVLVFLWAAGPDRGQPPSPAPPPIHQGRCPIDLFAPLPIGPADDGAEWCWFEGEDWA